MSNRPSVLCFVSDSLRADHVSAYGYERETTPNVDELAAEGVRFDNAYSQSIWTVPSSVAVLTGLYPAVHGATTTYDQIPENAPRIAERLKEAGYATAAFSTVTQVSERRNFDPGFETFDEIFRTDPPADSDPAKLCTDHVLDWLDTVEDDRPFFAFVWSFGTHEPYEPRAGEFTDESTPIDGSVDALADASYEQRDAVRDVYDDAIRYSDEQFGRLIAGLRERDRYDDTTVVFTADHGEVLSEHGRMEHAHGLVQRAGKGLAPGFCENYKLFDPSGRVGHLVVLPYDELIHVPLVLKPPEGYDWRGATDELVQLIDVMPTVADLAGVEFHTQGESLVDLIEDGEPVNDYVFSDMTQTGGVGRFKSVRSKTRKYVREELDTTSDLDHLEVGKTAFSIVRRFVVDDELLFAVPGAETEDLKAGEPETLSEFRRTFKAWEAANAEAGEEYINERAVVDDEVKEELRNLGYMQ